MRIREAEPQDAEDLQLLIVNAISPDLHEDFDESGWQHFLEMNSLAAIRRRIKNTEYLTLLCEVEESLAGLIAVKQFEKVDQLFVHPSFRRMGVARSLWQAAKSISNQKREAKHFWVKSSSMGVPVYQSFGFRLAGGKQTELGISYYPMTYGGEA